jgi:hypothetical protein
MERANTNCRVEWNGLATGKKAKDLAGKISHPPLMVALPRENDSIHNIIIIINSGLLVQIL